MPLIRPIFLLSLALFVSLSAWNLLKLTSILQQDFYDFQVPAGESSSQTAIVVNHNQHTDNLLKQDELAHWGKRTYRPNRVLCAVPTTWNYSAYKIERLQKTWGPFCDKLLFVLDSNDEIPPPENVTVGEVLKVNMTRSSDPKDRNIWTKVHLMWSAIAAKYINDAEWFLKVDDDTYLFVDHLRGFTQFYNPNIPRYMGHTILYRWKENIVFNVGSCYVLSRETLRRVTVKFNNMPTRPPGGPRDLCHDESGSGDDTSIAVCLREIGIMPENTMDAQGRNRFFPFELHYHYKIKRNDEFWFWKYKPNITGTEEKCCVLEEEVISAHNYKDKEDEHHFYALHEKALASRNHTPSVPPKPSLFWYDKEALDFEIDEWTNSLDPSNMGSKGFPGYE